MAANVTVRQVDGRLKSHLRKMSEQEGDYWSFRYKAVREHLHTCFQYPAMMVPQMQAELIAAVLKVAPKIKTLYEPFIGSGTVMTEGMARGLHVFGQDINPLAVLLCRVKSGPFFVNALENKIDLLIETIENDRRWRLEVDFPGRDKWFRSDVAKALSKIRRGIMTESSLWARRFFWIALAETVRLSSNSRTTTFKLHVRPKMEVQRELDPVATFIAILKRNLENLCSQKELLEEKCLIKAGRYARRISIHLRSASAASTWKKPSRFDLLVTSPPYGDNKTTVPYGQHSFLPLQWIELSDIDDTLDESCLASSHEIDSRSLGGSLAKALDAIDKLQELSPAFSRCMRRLRWEPEDRRIRVAAFCRDLDKCIEPTLAVLKQHAYMIWTIGNRRVANRFIPMDEILLELLAARGAEMVDRFQRNIPSKRMAPKNSITATMKRETVLLMRKR